jgi:DNA-binding SARP family transcriptional activator
VTAAALTDEHGSTPAEVEVRLLGGFLLLLGGTSVELPVSSQRLVAFLALHDGPVGRARVAGSLWPEKTEERAAANVRSALWRLNSCGAPVVDSRRCHLLLQDHVAVDLHAVDRWARSHTGERAAGDRWADVAGVAHEELLPDWYDDWVVLERERVRQRVLHGLEAECLALATAGDYGHSIDLGLVAIAADPLRESAQRAVITAHLAEGNRVEAFRQFDRYRRLLETELGIEPSTALLELLTSGAGLLQPA